MRVHERGSGETLSCGTGAVAAAVAAAATAGGWPGDGEGSRWTVDVPGGRLTVVPSATASLLTGPAVIVPEGETRLSWLPDPHAKAPVTARSGAPPGRADPAHPDPSHTRPPP